jgi:sugar phosphate isomerase/epimerase
MTTLLTRRSLVRNTSMLAATSLLPSTATRLFAQAKTLTNSPIRLGIASYTFRNFDQAHLITFMKEVKTRADEYRAVGFTLTAAGNVTFAKDDDADIQSKFEYAKLAGIPILVCAPTQQVLPRMEKFVKQYDIRLAIHAHGPEDKEFPSPLDVLAAVKNMDPRVGLCVDIGHTMRAGTDPVEAIRKSGPRLFDVHAKDLAVATEKDSQVAVGDGIMPIPAIFKTLIDQKYAGCVDLEYEIHGDDPMPGVIKSFAYMRGVLAGMGYKA